MIVHRGPRPGGLAPKESRTRFSWTLDYSQVDSVEVMKLAAGLRLPFLEAWGPPLYSPTAKIVRPSAVIAKIRLFPTT